MRTLIWINNLHIIAAKLFQIIGYCDIIYLSGCGAVGSARLLYRFTTCLFREDFRSLTFTVNFFRLFNLLFDTSIIYDYAYKVNYKIGKSFPQLDRMIEIVLFEQIFIYNMGVDHSGVYV